MRLYCDNILEFRMKTFSIFHIVYQKTIYDNVSVASVTTHNLKEKDTCGCLHIVTAGCLSLVATETVWPARPKIPLSGPLQKEC